MLALVVVFLASRASAVELPEVAEFHINDINEGALGWSWNGGVPLLWNALESVSPCSSSTSGNACSTSSGYHSSQSYTQKLSSWTDMQTYVRANIAVDGFWSSQYSQDPVALDHNSLHFVIGSGVGVKRTSISDAGALRLTEQAKGELKNPKDFLAAYGPYFISDIIYGARMVCAYTLQGYTVEDGAYLRELFEPISSNVFFDSAMSEAFNDKVEQALAAKKLKKDSLQCSLWQGGPVSPAILGLKPNTSPLAVAALFKKWEDEFLAEPSNLIPLRAEFGLIKDLQEVKEALQGMSEVEQAPLTSVPQITSDTTAKLEVDYALAMAARSSASWLLTQECAQADQALQLELEELKEKVTEYMVNSEKITGWGLSVAQEKFAKQDYSGLKGSSLNEEYLRLQKSCDAVVRL